MRFFIEHDEQGTIKSIGVLSSKPEEEQVYSELIPRQGHKIATIEIPEITDATDFERLKDVQRNYRVEEHLGQHRLASK